MIKATIVAGLGGFVGTMLRYLSDVLGAQICSGAYPLGIFIANIVGCYMIGVFYGWAHKAKILSKDMNVLLTVGLCGGFTTFSTYSRDMIDLIDRGDIGLFWLYMGTSVILGIVAVALGVSCVKAKVKGNNHKSTAHRPCSPQ